MFDLFGLEKNHKIAQDDEVALLTTVYDVAVLGMVRGILEDEKIPYLAHERATGSAMRIMTGFSVYGTDIFVPAEKLEEAQGAIAGLLPDGEEVTFVEDDEAASDADTPSNGGKDD